MASRSYSSGDGSPGKGSNDPNVAPTPATMSDSLRNQRENTAPSYAGSYGWDISPSSMQAVGDYMGSGEGGANVLNPAGGGTPAAPTGPTQAELNAAALAKAYDAAKQYGVDQVGVRGYNQGLIDQYGVLNAYNTMLDAQKAGLGSSSNPVFNTTTSFDQAVNDALGRYRSDQRNVLAGAGPQGFENELFGSTADDAVLQAILDSQQADAQTVLDRYRARGSLNDIGYNRAVSALGDQTKAGMSSLQSIGGGVLADYRKQLTDTYNSGLNNINNATFQSPYSGSTIADQLNKLKTDLGGSLEGDIYRAVGGNTFYQPQTAVSVGGVTQGTVNPSRLAPDNPLFQSFQQEQGANRRYANNSGSTASTGSF